MGRITRLGPLTAEQKKALNQWGQAMRDEKAPDIHKDCIPRSRVEAAIEVRVQAAQDPDDHYEGDGELELLHELLEAKS